jgi:hypothetical protein
MKCKQPCHQWLNNQPTVFVLMSSHILLTEVLEAHYINFPISKIHYVFINPDIKQIIKTDLRLQGSDNDILLGFGAS